MIFSHFQTRPLVDSRVPNSVSISTDLGLTTRKAIRTSRGWTLSDESTLTFAQIEMINADQNSCFRWVDEELQKAEAFSETTNRYYSLIPTPKAPSLLISGIPMHRIKDITPDLDTHNKIKALGKPYGRILDTATGLGYTAIKAAQTAERVITIEFDPAVIAICRMNPWSARLFNNPKICQIIGDTGEIAPIFADDSFDAILHDPPTFQLAGHLFSQDIYQTFYRILKQNGRMFHYIGNPDSHTGATVGRGVVKRLRQAGFSVSPHPKAFGVLAKK